MKHMRLKKLVVWILMLAMWAAMLPAGLAEALGPEAPVAELEEVALGEPEADADAAEEVEEAEVEEAQPVEASAAEVSETDEAEVTEPEISKPEATEPEISEAKTDESEATEAETTEPEVTGAETTEPEVTGVETDETEGLMAPVASGFHLNAESLRLGVKDKFELTAAMDGAPVSGPRFESSAPKVVAVSKAGVLTAKKAGSAVVTVVWGDYAAQCAVEVAKAPSKVTLTQTKASLGAGERLQLTASIPEGTWSSITWTSNKTSVATVDDDGLVRAISKGSATITAKTGNGKKATCKLTVAAAPTAIAFDRANVALSVGQTYIPNVKLTGGSAEYSLSVSGDAVTVSGNAVTAVQTGSAVVTASTYNGLSARLSVTVLPAPKSVRFEQDAYAIGEKDTLTLKPVFDADVLAGLTFKSSDVKVAPVTDDGVVTGKKAGKATITVTTHNGLRATCAVQVYKAPSKVTLNKTSLTLSAGDTFQLEAALPANSYSTITWSTDAPNVATVDQNGLVTAVGRGSAKITAITANKKKATCKLKVVAPPTKLTLSKSSMVLNKGKTDTVTWALDSEGEVDVAIEDTSVAAVSKISKNKVTVKALAVGETVLNAVTPNGLSASMTIVVAPVPTYLRLPESSVTLYVGDSYAIEPDTDAGGVSALTFTSSKSSVADVDDMGVVTARSAGSATITVKTANKKTAKLKVTVSKAPAALSVSPAAVELRPYEYIVLRVSQSSGVTFSSSNEYVAYVSKDGVVTGIHGGDATITAENGRGEVATCYVRVIDSASGLAVPAAPGTVRVTALSNTALRADWDAVSGADGYRVYYGTSASPDEATLYAGFGASTLSTDIQGLSAGLTWHVFVTAYNANGETDLSSAAHGQVRTPGQASNHTVSLNYSGDIMLALGSQKTLYASISPYDYTGALTWQTSSNAVGLSNQSNSGCVITAADPGEARVTALLDNGMSASLRVQVVDTGDLSDVNLTNVQKAVMKNEALMNEDEGDNVIWSLVEGRLEKSGFSQANASYVVEKVKSAETLFRDLYVLAQGTYNIVANATRDKRGASLGVSQFLMADNTLYLLPASSSTDSYAYQAFHESGHAVDFNGAERVALYSDTDAVNQVINDDVRQVLLDRMDEAIASAGVSAGNVSASRVADAVMDYRTLLNESAALSGLNSSEKQVYYALTDLLEAEMNATLPMNNGTMVWDAIEGATNFAVSGNYGHSYMLQMPQYREIAQYYYYDEKGNAEISAEPWAEFFSAKLMQDAATLAVNLAYLPKTCQYFAETLAPKLLDVFKNALSSK